MASAARAQTGKQQWLEGAPEVDVKYGVDNGIDGGVDVAEPDNERDYPLVHRRWTDAAAERKQDIDDEKRKPTGNERDLVSTSPHPT